MIAGMQLWIEAFTTKLILLRSKYEKRIRKSETLGWGKSRKDSETSHKLSADAAGKFKF